jgi:hypothetical protein
MERWEPVLRDHLKKYPKMEIRDVMKLLYQACFGPFHMAGSPSRLSLFRYLETELEDAKYHWNTLMIEPIGNDYHRLSIEAVTHALISKDELIDAFIRSSERPIDRIKAEKRFMSGLRAYERILENDEPARKALIACETEYLKKGIRALHHSDTYRTHYDPHYRVLHKDDIPIGVRHLIIDYT